MSSHEPTRYTAPPDTWTGKAVTLKDIAAIAGVSHSSVSRAVRGSEGLSEKTRTRILQLIEEHGYVPNTRAQTLASNVQHSVALVAPLHHSSIGQLMIAVSRECHRRNYTMACVNRNAETTGRDPFAERTESGVLDAMLFQGDTPEQWLEWKHKHLEGADDVVVVAIGFDGQSAGLNSVSVSRDEVARLCVSHLVSSGCTQLVFVNHASNGHESLEMSTSLALSANEFKAEKMADHGGNIGDQLEKALARRDDSHQAPLGVICEDYRAATYALTELKKRGVHVPEEAAIVALSPAGHALSDSTDITVVDHQVGRMGAEAMALLSKMLCNSNRQVEQVYVEPVLKVGQSSRSRALPVAC